MNKLFKDIPVAAVVAGLVTCVATVYVVLGANVGKKKRLRGPRGLVNSNRACYMNAVLQAFAASSVIQRWLQRCEPSPLKLALLKCLRVLNREEDAISEEITPSYLFQALRSQGFVITGEEQDAHELVQGLLDVIETDHGMADESSNNFCDPFKLSEEDPSHHGAFSRQGITPCPPPVTSPDEAPPFRGTITCRVDNQRQRSPTRSTVFNNVTLYLPPSGAQLLPITLESLLEAFVALEVVDEVTQQQSFARLPQCLCLHIQRTGFHCGVPYKRQEKVTFPLYLDMSQFVYSKQLCQTLKRSQSISSHVDESRNMFHLCAVICHFGGIQTGHYVTFRKCVLPGKKVRWFFTSDVDVRQVTLDEVMEANPYILLYEKMEGKPSPEPRVAVEDKV